MHEIVKEKDDTHEKENKSLIKALAVLRFFIHHSRHEILRSFKYLSNSFHIRAITNSPIM